MIISKPSFQHTHSQETDSLSLDLARILRQYSFYMCGVGLAMQDTQHFYPSSISLPFLFLSYLFPLLSFLLLFILSSFSFFYF